MNRAWLVIGHRGIRYGLDVRRVREIVWLPELSPIQEMPDFIVGVFNLRGRIVPVVDLWRRFGYEAEPYRLQDRIVVIEDAGRLCGIRVHELHDVVTLAEPDIEAVEHYQRLDGRARFISAEAKLPDALVMLLDIDAVLRESPSLAGLAIVDGPVPACVLAAPAAEERLVYRQRALALSQLGQVAGDALPVPYAIVRLGGELFGFNAHTVREFVHRRRLTPMPCSPPQIVGNLNLRGEILAVIDIRSLIGLSTPEAGEIVVFMMGEACLGVLAEEILEIVDLPASVLTAIPAASRASAEGCCTGFANLNGQNVSLLDMTRILALPPFAPSQL